MSDNPHGINAQVDRPLIIAKSNRMIRFAYAALFALAACQTTTTVAHDPSGALGTCPAPAFEDYVGQPFDQVTIQWEHLRVLRPGDIMTMDYRQDRLNIELDEADVIARIFCG